MSPEAGLREAWTLEPDVAFLNHGSFGACPRVVLDAQAAQRARMEAEPVRFFVRELEPLLAEVRARVAAFVGAAEDDVVFVRNATEGCNAVLRSLDLAPGQTIVRTSHGYGAVNHTIDYVCERAGAGVVVAELPFPIAGPEEAIGAVLGAVDERTRLVVIDHVTSPTGVVLPIAELVGALRERGVETLIDGAHGPGMFDLDLQGLGAGYYTGNFHKWCCAPKGAALLHVRRDLQPSVLPTRISHGYRSPRPRSRFLETFDWTGTDDPTALLCVPAALDFLASIDGFGALREEAFARLRRGRDRLADALGVAAPVPDAMLGLLAALPLPDGDGAPPTSALYLDALQLALFERHRVEVPIVPWPAPPRRLIRISSALYTTDEELERLVAGLAAEL